MTTIAGVKLADLKRPKESLSPGNVGKLSPDPYSFEHRISLDQDALDKLKPGELKAGDHVHVMGVGHVHSVSDNNGKKTVGIQFKKMHMKKAPAGGGAFGAVSQGIKDAQS